MSSMGMEVWMLVSSRERLCGWRFSNSSSKGSEYGGGEGGSADWWECLALHVDMLAIGQAPLCTHAFSPLELVYRLN